ncbi:MAG: ABC transporter substrate-binding protein [Fimbriimonadaceae bacterium]
MNDLSIPHRLSRCVAWFAPVVLLLVLISGCAQEARTSAEQQSKPVTKIVSLSPGTTEVVFAMVDPRLVVGRTSACDWPEPAENVPIVATTKPDYEQLRAINPDLVVYDADLYSDDEIEKIRQLGIETFAFNPKNLEEYELLVTQLGSRAHRELTASAQLDTIHGSILMARQDAPNPPVPAMFVTVGGGDYLAAGTKSFLADIASNAGIEVVGPDSTKFEPMSAEAIVQANPAIIFVAGREAQGIEVARDPRLATVRAVQAEQIYAVDPDLLLRRGARVKLLIDGLSRIMIAKGTEQ